MKILLWMILSVPLVTVNIMQLYTYLYFNGMPFEDPTTFVLRLES